MKQRESKAQILEEIGRLEKEKEDEHFYDGPEVIRLRASILLILRE